MVADNRTHNLLTVILIGGFLLRFAGIFWGVPFFSEYQTYFHADEIKIMKDIAGFPAFLFTMEDLRYPTLLHELVGAFAFLTKPLVTAFGGDMWAFSYMSGRMLSVLLGTATIYLAYRLGSLVYHEKAGVAAALAVALLPGHIQSSAWVTVDVLAAFLFTWFLLTAYQAVYEESSYKNYALAGVLLGLAAGAKYVSALGAIYMLALFTMRALETRKLSIGKLTVAGFISAIVLIITTPGIIFSFEHFVQSLRFEMMRADFSQDISGKHTLLHMFARTLNAYVECMGIVAVFSLVNLGYCIATFRRQRHPIEWAGVILVLTFLAFFNDALMARYVLMIAPLVCVLAFEPLVAQCLRSKGGGAILAFMAAVLAYQGIQPIVLRYQDSRIQAARYITEHIPKGAVIGVHPGYHAPRVNAQDYALATQFPYDNAEYMIWTGYVEEKAAARADTHFGFGGMKPPSQEEREFHKQLAAGKLPEYELVATFGGEALPLHFSSPAIGIFRVQKPDIRSQK